MSTGKMLLAALLTSLVAAKGPAFESAPSNPAAELARRDAEVRDVMDAAGMPGVQTVVVKNGHIVWQRSYGRAVLAIPGPERPMRDNTILMSASIGKVLTAIAVMQQVEQRHIALDDDIDRSVPFVVRNPKWPDAPITWRMLLNHSSSLADDEGVVDTLYVYGRDPAQSLNEYIEASFAWNHSPARAHTFTDAKPGSARVYSNIEFDLLGYALSRVAHEPYAEYMSRHVFAPLKMTETSILMRSRPESLFAIGYDRARSSASRWLFTPNRDHYGLPHASTFLGNIFTAPNTPSGIFFSNARDFARPVMMLLNHGTLDGVRILDSTTVDEMLTPSGLHSKYNYSQGLCLFSTDDLDDQAVWGHDGEERGFVTALFFNRATGIGAVSFANANRDDFLLSRRLVDLDLHMMDWFK